MLGVHPLMAFLATREPARAREFYGEVLGLRLVTEDPFALVFDAHGTTLRIQKVDALRPQPFTALGWHVPDVVATAKVLTERGVTFERYPGMMDQDPLGIWTAPGGARIAWFRDPDGNVLSLTQLP